MPCLSPDDTAELGEGVALSEVVDSGVGEGAVMSSEMLDAEPDASVEADVELAAAKSGRGQGKRGEWRAGEGGGCSIAISHRQGWQEHTARRVYGGEGSLHTPLMCVPYGAYREIRTKDPRQKLG